MKLHVSRKPFQSQTLGLCGWIVVIALVQASLTMCSCGQLVWAQESKPLPKHAIDSSHDEQLVQLLSAAGFTGNIEASLTKRLGRKLDKRKVDLGRDLFFDPILGLRGDNSCAGCHSPRNGFGDSQSIAIGIFNNNKVGPNRLGPRNQRRSPMLLNVAFFPRLMWNGRFSALSGNPFDNSQGFLFPLPEGQDKFPARDSKFKHLLVAQAHIPPTELVEMTGFRATTQTVDSKFSVFDDGRGSKVPGPDSNGYRNDAIRGRVLRILNRNKAYRALFRRAFPNLGRKLTRKIGFEHIGQAMAEFQFSLTRANAPIDRYARGNRSAMSRSQKRGAIVFFGKAECVNCHSVAGNSFEMFSDFENHRIGVPQLAPVFGSRSGDVVFDGPDADQDFGAEQISGDPADRYKFRTSPLRNVALQPTFFHDGAFTRLSDAVRHHLNVLESARAYDPKAAGVKGDLRHQQSPIEPLLVGIDPLITDPIVLTNSEFDDLVQFLTLGLLDPRASPHDLCQIIPERVPSGRKMQDFEECK